MGPGGRALAIDIAWLGSSSPRRVLVHSSGLHGVEGFAGSAIQIALLERGLRIPADAAVVFVHVLNPYGMAWLRRVNENNVDLNRNFGTRDEDRAGASAEYRRLDPLLNPPSAPGADLFYLLAAWNVLRHGPRPLRQAIAEGQYEFPGGLFFGGAELERGPALFQDWLARHLTAPKRICAIDVHTGLGRWGRESLGGAYTIRGGYRHAFDVLPQRPQVSAVTQEFGTYSSLRVLHALREENRCHHYGAPDISHPAKRRLKEMFAPASESWRRFVVERGVALFDATLQGGWA